MSQVDGKNATPTRPRESSARPIDHFDWRTFDPAMLPDGMNSPLAAELITYRDHLDEMLPAHAGEYVVIKGDRIVGYYRSRPAAVRAVSVAFGRDPALVKQVADTEPIRRVGGVVN